MRRLEFAIALLLRAAPAFAAAGGPVERLYFGDVLAGWSSEDASSGRLLRADGPGGQSFSVSRGAPAAENALAEEASRRWEGYLTTRLVGGEPVFLKKLPAAGGSFEGVLLCGGLRHSFKGRVEARMSVFGLLQGLRCANRPPERVGTISASPEGPSGNAARLEYGAAPAAPRLTKHSVGGIVDAAVGRDLLGKTREEVSAVRPAIQLRHYSFLGPVKTEEYTEFLQAPFEMTVLYVFEGWGKLKLRRVILQPKIPLPRAEFERILRETSKEHGEGARSPQPYLSGTDGKWDPGGQIRKIGSSLADRIRGEKEAVQTSLSDVTAPWAADDVQLWRSKPYWLWFSDRELGFGSPPLKSRRYIKDSYVLWIAGAVALFFAWLLVYWTPFYDAMPGFVKFLLDLALRAALAAVLIAYPLGTIGWFFYEAYHEGYLNL